MQIWSLRIWRRLFARTAWNGCRRGRFSVSARYGERETEEETDREIEIERANARHPNPKSHSRSNRTNRREKERSVSFLAPQKNIYERERDRSIRPGDPSTRPSNRNRTTASREDESNDAPRESQQSTIRQTLFLVILLPCACVNILRAFSCSMMDFQ